MLTDDFPLGCQVLSLSAALLVSEGGRKAHAGAGGAMLSRLGERHAGRAGCRRRGGAGSPAAHADGSVGSEGFPFPLASLAKDPSASITGWILGLLLVFFFLIKEKSVRVC